MGWSAALRGPRGTPYEGGAFWLGLQLPSAWPAEPPRVRFVTPIYHCNVRENGELIPTLPRSLGTWSSHRTIFCFLAALVELLCVPDTAEVARPELAAQYAE